MQAAKTAFLFFLTLAVCAQSKKIAPYKGISLKLPSAFVVMADDDIAQKYPTYKKPLAMYVSKDATAEFGINAAVNNWSNKNLEVLRSIYRSTIMSIFYNVNFSKDGEIATINDRKYVLFEFTSEIKDDKRIDESTVLMRRYNYLAYTIYANKILIFNFNADFKKREQWAPQANEIIQSIKISNNLKLPDFVPYKTEGPQPKEIKGRRDIQMEAIKKLNKK